MATTENWQLPSAFVSEQRYLLPSSRAGSSALRSTGSGSAKRVPARSLKMELLQGSCRGVEVANVFVRPVGTGRRPCRACDARAGARSGVCSVG